MIKNKILIVILLILSSITIFSQDIKYFPAISTKYLEVIDSINMTNNRIVNVADPIYDYDAVNKRFLITFLPDTANLAKRALISDSALIALISDSALISKKALISDSALIALLSDRALMSDSALIALFSDSALVAKNVNIKNDSLLIVNSDTINFKDLTIKDFYLNSNIINLIQGNNVFTLDLSGYVIPDSVVFESELIAELEGIRDSLQNHSDSIALFSNALIDIYNQLDDTIVNAVYDTYNVASTNQVINFPVEFADTTYFYSIKAQYKESSIYGEIPYNNPITNLRLYTNRITFTLKENKGYIQYLVMDTIQLNLVEGFPTETDPVYVSDSVKYIEFADTLNTIATKNELNGKQATLTNPVTSPVAGVSGYIPAYSGATTIDSTNIYYDNGNVGIGTTNPTQKLSVAGNILSTTIGMDVFRITDGTKIFLNVNAVADNSNFLGASAGNGATGASNSNFFGINAGNGATSASYSNFLGQNAGYLATSAYHSNFFGYSAGSGATNAYRSNFLGQNAGSGATNASYSNFFGYSAGSGATSASYSNFLGQNAGYLATSAYHSNFFGQSAGNGATSASYSNFFGNSAGNGATGASFSNFLGYHVGQTFTGNNVGSNNIIIGTNISLPDAAANAMNLGGVLFGTGTYATTSGDPSILPANGKIGINVVTPTEALDIAGNTKITGDLTVTGDIMNETPHCYFYKVDTVSFPLVLTTNVWQNINISGMVDKESHSINISGVDTLQYQGTKSCHMLINVNINGTTSNANDDIWFRIVNITDNTVIDYDFRTSAGLNNYGRWGVNAYDNACDPNDKYVLQIKNITNGNDMILHRVSILFNTLHFE